MIENLFRGGNLAAVLALKSAEASFNPPLPKPMVLQLLIVPSLDITAEGTRRWESNKHAPFLTPDLTIWFKDMYLRNEEDASKWEVSPLLAPEELLRKAPKAWVAASELDILCKDAEEYTERLKSCGVEAKCVIYKGGVHMNFALDGVFFYWSTLERSLI